MEQQPTALLTDSQIAAALLAIIQKRGVTARACPSEVARQLAPQDWRALILRVRSVASSLAQAGLLEIAQRGKAVSPLGPWRGPIRVRLTVMHAQAKRPDA